ncbi:DNA replication factor C, large subunit [Mollisia scopiformis]|uniref:Replication factor C subunit 1 n=1 Tax=Mollisia scopiformis TaxID=149040 RepID=A0A194XF85_MOLSC|nr:DNA replication factor C, large subunit [Mollisia scopiformis]KUJ18427.1 DNA replication factor C, large subunit [Mollisia scopiformis]
MPPDIRNFFGAKTQTPIREKETKETKKGDDSKKKRGKSRKVIEDSDDDEPTPAVKKSTPKKAPAKKAVKQESPKGQETSTTDYFATSSKPKPTKTTSAKATPVKTKNPPKFETNGRSSARKKTATSYKEEEDDDDFAIPLDDDEEGADDIFATDVKTSGKRKDDGYVESDSNDEPIVVPKKTANAKAKGSKKEDVEMKDASDSFVLADESDDMMVIDKPAPKTTGKKRKSVDLESEDDEEDVKPKTKSVKAKSSKPPPAKKPRAPKKNEPESSAVQAILDNIPTVRAPTPPPPDASAKWDWKKGGGGGGNAGPPAGAGSKEIPVGAENCLAGMTFVFTGLLESISREEGTELVKRYGGKVTGAPSSKTTAVVLGNDAGPSKLRKIAELKIRTINEDGLFAMISQLPANGGDGKAAEKTMEKKRAEMEKIKKEAEEMEREEKRKAAEAEKAEKEAQKQAALKGTSAPAPTRKVAPTAQLWTSKYAPTSMNQICGNKGQVEKIQAWLKGWAKAHKYNFEKKGPDGLGGYRAIIIHGPPGIGKTTAAHLAAKLAGYDVIESNASDTRSKKLVETGLNDVLDNNSLLGYFSGNGKDIDKQKKNIVLIMDEVDGMSAGDRGGVGALAKVCKKTHIPMILICNDRKLPKMKPFDFVTFDIPFRRPTLDQIRSRIATICHREGLKLPMNVIDALVEGSNKDIRQIINMLSTAKLDQTSMDFDQSKAMSKAWEKHVILKPWDICHKLLGGGMFAPSSKSTLNDKIELYFNDHEFSYLMIQENYLSTKPILVGSRQGREAKLKELQLADQAAESISDGDLVDRMIHGSQQQWSLMPTHAVFSAVRPASFVSGMMTGQTSFTSWLGNNSKQQKLVRYVKEIQSHMRLRTSGDRHEIRQQYLPVLWIQMIKRLELEGKDCVDEVIDLMDSYFLTRDDFDYMMELGLGPQDQELVKLETQTKSTFTRLYNGRSHPLPFMKASNVVAPAKQKKEAPDLEEAIEEEDEGDAVEEPTKEEAEEIDFKKDKYIKQPKVKKAAAKKATKKTKGKGDDEGEPDDDDDEDEKPKKKAKSKASTAKGKGKK